LREESRLYALFEALVLEVVALDRKDESDTCWFLNS